jgi:hypothetical protein
MSDRVEEIEKRLDALRRGPVSGLTIAVPDHMREWWDVWSHAPSDLVFLLEEVKRLRREIDADDAVYDALMGPPRKP